jgi:hypothetical protein
MRSFLAVWIGDAGIWLIHKCKHTRDRNDFLEVVQVVKITG